MGSGIGAMRICGRVHGLPLDMPLGVRAGRSWPDPKREPPKENWAAASGMNGEGASTASPMPTPSATARGRTVLGRRVERFMGTIPPQRAPYHCGYGGNSRPTCGVGVQDAARAPPGHSGQGHARREARRSVAAPPHDQVAVGIDEAAHDAAAVVGRVSGSVEADAPMAVAPAAMPPVAVAPVAAVVLEAAVPALGGGGRP